MSHSQRISQHHKCNCKECGCSGFNLELSSILALDVAIDQSQSGISANGQLLFFAPVTFTPAAEDIPALILFQNTTPDLTEVARVEADPLFPILTGAASNEDLSLIALLGISEAGTLSIRVFARTNTNDLVLVRTISLPDVIDIDGTTVLSPELFDGRFVSISYTTPGGQLVAIVVDVTTGVTIARVEPTNANIANVTTLFRLHKKLYLAIGPANIDFDTFVLVSSFLEIYRLSRHGPKLVEQVQVPTLINDIDVPDNSIGACKTLLAIGLSRVDVPGHASIYPFPPLNNLTGEPSGARVYKFDGCNLEIAASIPQSLSVYGVAFSPSGRYLAINMPMSFGNAFDSALVYRLDCGFDPNLKDIRFSPIADKTFCPVIVEAEPVPGSSFITEFSRNGQWFLATGGYAEVPDQPYITLYRVCATGERTCH